MELAKVTSKGQITIPVLIRNKLQLKTGDKVFFEENKGKIYITNASQMTLSSVQAQMRGEAEKASFQTEDDVVTYIKELRKAK
ncbi:MAG: AbrB/MazE/SpoVT family DNA-binding domain-containing protein [Treponema sp.]|nr:AbrB/MazE/SpoVT family DNA-binding domain-containing protein [Treponema sp.]